MEPTDEMLDELVDAFVRVRAAYWKARDADTGEGMDAGPSIAEHERVAQRQAMKAALAVVEREYEPIRCDQAMGLYRRCTNPRGHDGDHYSRFSETTWPAGERPEMLSDRLGYPASVGDEGWERLRCKVTERCLLKGGHDGPHGFGVTAWKDPS